MNKVLKALADSLHVSTTEISKHFADETFQLLSDDMDERFADSSKIADELIELVSGFDKTKEGFGEELKLLFDRLGETRVELETVIENGKTVSNENFTSIYDDICKVKDALVELSEIVDSKDDINMLTDTVKDLSDTVEKGSVADAERVNGIVVDINKSVSEVRAELNTGIDVVSLEVSRVAAAGVNIAEATTERFDVVDGETVRLIENINLLADSVKDITERHEASTNITTASISDVIETMTVVTKSVVDLGKTIASGDEDLAETISDINKRIDDAMGGIDETLKSNYIEYTESIEDIIGRIAKFDDRVTSLKSSLIGYGEDLATLSNDTHKQIEKLNGKTFSLAEYATNVRSDVDAQGDIIESIVDSTTHIQEAVDHSNKRIDTVDQRVNVTSTQIDKSNGRIVVCEDSVADLSDDVKTISDDLTDSLDASALNNELFATSLNNCSEDLSKLAGSNSLMLEDVEKMTSLLSEQFQELKNESFLSSDKIDTKFAEIKLLIVEEDVRRNAFVKESITEQCKDIQKAIEVDFKEYRRNIGNQVEASNELVVKDVGQMLVADKLMINRSKQWVPGTEYGVGVVSRNIGGIWQASRTTTDEPTGKSNDWFCISSGLDKVTVLDTHRNGVEIVIGIHDSLGNVSELSIPLPTISYLKGVYQDNVDYGHLDSIMKDGCRWVATKDIPQGVPGDDVSDWQVLTMRGPRGMQGKTGETGPRGLPGKEGKRGLKGAPGKEGKAGESSRADYLYTKNMLSPSLTRKELNDLIKTPIDGQITIVHSDIGIERYFRCEYIGEIDKWIVELVNAV